MSTLSTFQPSFVWISPIWARRTSVRGVGEALFVTVSSTTPNTEAVVPSIDSTNTERTLPALVAWADLIAATVWAPKNCLTCPAKSPTAYDLIRATSAEIVAALKFVSAVRKVVVWATTSARRRSSDWARSHSEANSTAAASVRTNSVHGTASHRPERGRGRGRPLRCDPAGRGALAGRPPIWGSSGAAPGAGAPFASTFAGRGSGAGRSAVSPRAFIRRSSNRRPATPVLAPSRV